MSFRPSPQQTPKSAFETDMETPRRMAQTRTNAADWESQNGLFRLGQTTRPCGRIGSCSGLRIHGAAFVWFMDCRLDGRVGDVHEDE